MTLILKPNVSLLCKSLSPVIMGVKANQEVGLIHSQDLRKTIH